MEVDDKSLMSALPRRETNQSVVSSTVMQNKGKAKATNADRRCQEVEEMEQCLEEVIQHAEDAGADPELTRASIDDEGVQAVVAALLAHIDVLRNKAQVMERGKERVEAENAKLREELRRMRDEHQHWDASPLRDSANKQQWGRKRKAPEPREQPSNSQQPLPRDIRPLPAMFSRDPPQQPSHFARPLECKLSRASSRMQGREAPMPEWQSRGSDSHPREAVSQEVQPKAQPSHSMTRDPNPVVSSSQQRSSNQSRPKEEGLITTYLLLKPYPLHPPLPNIPAPELRKAMSEPKKKVEHSPYSESDDSDSGRSSPPERRSTKKDNSSLAEHNANRSANLSEGPFLELLGVVFRDDRWQRDNRFWRMYPRDFWYNERTNSLYPGPLASSMYDWNEGR